MNYTKEFPTRDGFYFARSAGVVTVVEVSHDGSGEVRMRRSVTTAWSTATTLPSTPGRSPCQAK